jgi:hypothetical protein
MIAAKAIFVFIQPIPKAGLKRDVDIDGFLTRDLARIYRIWDGPRLTT